MSIIASPQALLEPLANDKQPQASWLAIGSLSVGAFALVTTEFLPVGLLPAIGREIGISNGETGLMVTLPGFVAAATAPLSIHFAGHAERRKVLTILLVCLLLSNLIVAFATSFAQLLTGRALLGVAIGSFWTMAGALGPRLRPGAEGIRASALILGGVSVGTVAGVPAGSLLGELWGWRYAFAGGAVLAALAILAIILLLPKIPASDGTKLRDIAVILRDRHDRIRLLGVMTLVVGSFAAYTYVAPYLERSAGISGQLLSAVLLANGVAGFIGNIAGGWLAGREPRHAVMWNATIIIIAVIALALLGNHPISAMVFVAIWGFAFGMQPISLQSWTQSLAPRRLEAMQGLFVSMTQAAVGLGSLLGGLVADHLNLTSAVLIAPVAALVTLCVAALFPSERPTLNLE